MTPQAPLPPYNPDKIGEFDAFYYQILPVGSDGVVFPDPPVDSGSSDGVLLEAYEDGWLDFCIMSLDITQTFEEHTFNDRCSPDMEEVAPGRKNFSLGFELNQVRLADEAEHNLRDWHAAVDSRQMFLVMGLTAAIIPTLDTTTQGFVGHFIITQADETQPDAGPNTDSYTMRPAARFNQPTGVILRRVYGSALYPAP